MSERDELIDCLRYRPVATTATQMRKAADLLERDGDEIERLGRELAEAEQSRAINHASAKIALDQRDTLRAENEALQKKAARADYVAKAFVLEDDDAIFEFCMAESVAEFNAAIDAVLAKRADEAKERTP